MKFHNQSSILLLPVYLLILGGLFAAGCSRPLTLFPGGNPVGFVKIFGGTGFNKGVDLIFNREDNTYTLIGSFGFEDEYTDRIGAFSIFQNSYLYVVQTDEQGELLRQAAFNHDINERNQLPNLEGVSIIQAGTNRLIALGKLSQVSENGVPRSGVEIISLQYDQANIFETDRKRILSANVSRYPIQIIADPLGGYLILSTTDSIDQTKSAAPGFFDSTDVSLIKLNEDLGLVWEKQYGYGGLERAVSMEKVEGGGFILSAESEGPEGELEALLLKVDALGNPLLARKIGYSEGWLFPGSMAIKGNSLYLLSQISNFVSPGGDGIRLSEFDVHTLASVGPDVDYFDPDSRPGSTSDRIKYLRATSLSVLPEGGFVYSGMIVNNNRDLFLNRLDENKNQLPGWPLLYGDVELDDAGTILPISASGQTVGFMTVATLGFKPVTMMGLIKTDANGQLDP